MFLSSNSGCSSKNLQHPSTRDWYRCLRYDITGHNVRQLRRIWRRCSEPPLVKYATGHELLPFWRSRQDLIKAPRYSCSTLQRCRMNLLLSFVTCNTPKSLVILTWCYEERIFRHDAEMRKVSSDFVRALYLLAQQFQSFFRCECKEDLIISWFLSFSNSLFFPFYLL